VTSQTVPVPQARAAAAPALVRYGKSLGIGAAFAVGWTPCIGPILGAILNLAVSSASILHATFLLTAWSAGFGVPFLITGLMIGQVMRGMRRIRPVMPVLEVAGGLLVVFIGCLIFLDRFTVFNQYFTGFNATGDAEQGLSGIEVTSLFGFVVAFAAGIIAFLSPCCLPMVPAYIAHLAGVSANVDEAQRGVTFRHALAFVLGFSIVFVALGASLGAAGFFLQDHLPTIEKVAGVLLIVLGLNLMGILRIPWLYRTYQFEVASSPNVAGPP
jgi:cytochrome c biogenesis protein CcdA